MARLHGSDISACSINSVSLLPDLVSIDYEDGADLHETTTMGDNSHEFTAGLKAGKDISLSLFYNNTASTGCYALLTGLIGGAATTFSFADGTRTTAVSVHVASVKPSFKVNDMSMLTATLRQSGDVTYS